MKFIYKTALSSAALLLCGSLWGQSMNDIYNLQRASMRYGTPRYMGMSGAFGAVGGEVSAATINPAAGAVAVKSEASFTLGAEWYDNKATFYGNKTGKTSDINVTAFQGGANFIFKNDNPYSSVAGFNIGINYSRRNNFNNEVVASGRNNTITDWSQGGVPYGSSIIESIFRNARDGVNSTVVDMAKDLGVLYVDQNNLLQTGADYLDIDQLAHLISSGYMGTTTFSAGINIDNKVYFGIGFDYYSLDLGKNDIKLDEWGYTSNSAIPHNGISNLYYDRYTAQTGWGSAFTLGVIGRVTDEFRLGFSWKSAARIYIDEDYSYAMGAKFFDNTFNEGTEHPTYYAPNSYSFKSPSEWTFSAAYVFGQYGILSADYMVKDFSKMRFKTNGFEGQNNIIADQMKISQTIRVGAEARLYPVSIRAGFSYISSPYRDLTVERVSQTIPGNRYQATLPQGTGNTLGFSAGLGYSIGNFLTIDASYVNSSYKTYTYLYEPKLIDPIENKVSASYVALGATFRF